MSGFAIVVNTSNTRRISGDYRIHSRKKNTLIKDTLGYVVLEDNKFYVISNHEKYEIYPININECTDVYTFNVKEYSGILRICITDENQRRNYKKYMPYYPSQKVSGNIIKEKDVTYFKITNFLNTNNEVERKHFIENKKELIENYFKSLETNE